MSRVLELTWRSFGLPKSGNAKNEYEDAVAGDPERGRFAIADGASESAFAGTWATALVRSYVQIAGPWARWLATARDHWRVQSPKDDLPWYTATRLDEGAYAALLVVAFRGEQWRATAVGDCCLFHVRGQRLLRAFPVRNSGDFANRPLLLGSRARQPSEMRARRFHTQGDLRRDDVLFLMTDALAQWFLSRSEQGVEPWHELQAVASEERFGRLIAGLRESGDLRNDDVTLVTIQST